MTNQEILQQKIDEITKEVAEQNGVVLNENDPLLMLVTVMAMIELQTQQGMIGALQVVSEDLEEAFKKNEQATKELAERMVKAVVATFRSSFEANTKEAVREISESLRKEADAATERIQTQSRTLERLHWYSLGILGVGLLAVGFSIWFVWYFS